MNAIVFKNSKPIFSNPWTLHSAYLENKKTISLKKKDPEYRFIFH